jgi:uncharacterized RDD family membrane protein YckC
VFVDGFILFILAFVFLIFLLIVGVDEPPGVNPDGSPDLGWMVFWHIVGWVYFAGFESSHMQATPGKAALGLKVTDLNGNQIGFGTATGRYFGRILSGILYIGYIMVAFTERKQGLHDMLAGTLVVKQ